MPSARIVVAVLCTRRPGKQHHIGYHGNSRAENETILHASLRECKQVGGLTRLMCSRYVGQRPNCSTIDPPSERAMPAAAAVSREARCSAACILVVHGADHADQPVSSAAETLLSNRACRDEVRYVLHCTALSVLYGSSINNQPSSFLRACVCVCQVVLLLHNTHVPPRGPGTVALTGGMASVRITTSPQRHHALCTTTVT